jgi:hypothetical protein
MNVPRLNVDDANKGNVVGSFQSSICCDDADDIFIIVEREEEEQIDSSLPLLDDPIEDSQAKSNSELLVTESVSRKHPRDYCVVRTSQEEAESVIGMLLYII